MRESPYPLESSATCFVATGPRVTFSAFDCSHGQEAYVNIERLTTPWWALRDEDRDNVGELSLIDHRTEVSA